jgi:hypothetical protein
MKKTLGLAIGLFLLALLSACAEGPRPLAHTSPEVLFEPPPVYPEAALASKARGQVDLSVSVDEIGLPREVRVIHEEPVGSGFGEAAAEALRGSIWRPATIQGTPVEETWSVSIRFDPVITFGTRRLPVLLQETRCEAYDEEAVRVVVAADIDDHGSPDFLEVVAQDPPGEGFREAAIRCVSGWRWVPGRPGQTYVVVRIGARSEKGKNIRSGR